MFASVQPNDEPVIKMRRRRRTKASGKKILVTSRILAFSTLRRMLPSHFKISWLTPVRPLERIVQGCAGFSYIRLQTEGSFNQLTQERVLNQERIRRQYLLPLGQRRE